MQPVLEANRTPISPESCGPIETPRTYLPVKSPPFSCLGLTATHQRRRPTCQCLEDYREQLMAMLSSAREIAAKSIQRAQKTYKHQYNCNARPSNLRGGDWVLVRFPQDESGRFRKLSRPWHGPYRVLERQDPDVAIAKVYHPQHGQICIHQSRVCGCPDDFPARYYWYGGKQKGPGQPPKWVERLLDWRLPAQQCDRPSEGEQCPSGQPPRSNYANSAIQNLFLQSVTPLLQLQT